MVCGREATDPSASRSSPALVPCSASLASGDLTGNVTVGACSDLGKPPSTLEIALFLQRGPRKTST
jgi:hypothetical protein